MRWVVPVYDLANGVMGINRLRSRFLREHVRPGPGQVLLDVGCGTGDLVLEALSLAGGDLRATGIDPSPWMIDKARKKAARKGIDADFRAGVIESLPFEDRSVDTVTSSLMFHHLTDDLKRRGLAEIERVLKPGGRFLVLDLSRVRGPALLILWVHFYNPPFRSQALHGLEGVLRDNGFGQVRRVMRWWWAVEAFEARFSV